MRNPRLRAAIVASVFPSKSIEIMLHRRPRGSASHRVRPGGHCKAGDRPLRPWSTMNQPGQGRCCRMKDDDAGVNHESAHRNRSSARSSALSLCWRPSRAWRMASAGWRVTTALARAASVREADGVGQADGPGRPGWATTPVYPARDPSKTRSDLARRSSGEEDSRSLKPFRWNPAGNQSRPVEPDQQPEASLAWWVGDRPCEA